MHPFPKPSCTLLTLLVIPALGCDDAAAAPSKRASTPPPRFDAKKTFVKPSAVALKKRLTALSFYVTQENGTERPFENRFWNEKRAGIYVDIVSGEPLFSSRDKFDSRTGWPSFERPLVRSNIVEVKDSSHGMVRIELRSRRANSHLGHLFDDGPSPTKLRYCINSAALHFVPASQLGKAGYASYAGLLFAKRPRR